MLFDLVRIGEEGYDAHAFNVGSPPASDAPAFIISTTLNLRFRPNTRISSRIGRIRVRKPSINQGCEGTGRPLLQGTCVVPGVQLNLPLKLDVINTNVLHFLNPRLGVRQGHNQNRLSLILFEIMDDLLD